MNWCLLPWKRYTDFSGRSRRMEYWIFTLFNCIVFCALEAVLLTMMLAGQRSSAIAILVSVLVMLYGVAVLIPSLAVTVRRLHDIGKSGWWIFLGFVPIVGGIILLVWYFFDSQPGDNMYGPNPKNPAPTTVIG